jgi:hypothetical protein
MVVMLLLVFAVSILVAGVASLGQATQGVGIIAVACFLAILARMLQANNQHNEQMAMLKGQRQVDRT